MIRIGRPRASTRHQPSCQAVATAGAPGRGRSTDPAVTGATTVPGITRVTDQVPVP
jgi:hypothetical protein